MHEHARPDALPVSARQSTLRVSNLSLVMRCVCAAEEPVSRAGVAMATGLTRSTVSRLVDDLVLGGLVEEGSPQLAGPGRPAVPLRTASHGVGALGLQVNAAHVAVRLIGLGGDVVAESRSEPDLVGSEPAEGLRLLTEQTRQVIAAVPRGMRLLGAGLALPGVVDPTGNRLLKAPNLGWHDVDPTGDSRLTEVLGGLPLELANEANCAAHAVAHPRPGRRGSVGDFVYVSGEIGIGGAVVLDGQVQTGPRGFAGEIGHMTYLPDGDTCPCGSRGCLERYAGRLAMTRRAGLAPGATLADLGSRAAAGEPGSRAALELAGEALGVVLAGVVNLLDVATVVLGGEIGDVSAELAPRVERILRQRVMAADWMSLQVRRDPDDVGGATGAALVQLSRVVADPAAFLG